MARKGAGTQRARARKLRKTLRMARKGARTQRARARKTLRKTHSFASIRGRILI